MDILNIENVTKRYEGHTALDDVSLSIPKGSVYGLLGPNGAGKTTLIRIINRITAPDSGTVRFEGNLSSPSDVNHIGYLPEERGLYKKMKVGQQALYFARLKGMGKREATEKLREWFRKFEIEHWWDRKVEELSKGMAQKVQFIITVVHQPKLLILDEPFSGFDPINANLLKSEILALRDQGSTVIFSTHNMNSVEEICDHITLINRSRNVLSGTVKDIRRHYGQEIFRVAFRGDALTLRRALEPLCEVLPASEDAGSLQFRLRGTGDMREIIDRINSTVGMRSFNELVPSMNDIFIKAVEESKNG